MKNLIGTTIGQHEIQEQLGRGGMANVYKAFHPGLAVYRAIKVIRPDLADTKGFQDRFQREARAVAALRHPNIVQIHDFGQVDDLFYMIMEFVEGEDLKTRMRREGEIRPFSEAVRLTEEIGDALGYAHSRGVVHRDVKPDNVLLDKDGRAILADFGIAKMIGSDDAQLTATGTGLGTPAYMAPEQAMGATDVDEQADLYALGVVLYEMLTARLPFHADTPLAVLQRVIYDPVPPPREFTADIPDALQGVVLKAMAKEPGQRYPNAAALVEAAKQSLSGIGVSAIPAVATVPPPPPAHSSVTDGGTVILEGDRAGGTVEPLSGQPTADTRPVEGADREGRQPTATQVAQPSAGDVTKKSRAPLFAALAMLGLLLLLGVAVVGTGVWWFSLRGVDVENPDNEVLTAFTELTGGAGGFSDPEVSPSASENAVNSPLEGAGEPDGAGKSVATEPGGASPVQTRTGSGARDRSPDPNADLSSPGASGKPSAEAQPSKENQDWRERRPSAQGSSPVQAASLPSGSVSASPSARFLGRMRFGSSAYGEVEPEQAVEYELEIKRPTTFYFDIVQANRRATYTFRAPDGSEVFHNEGADVGPLTLEQEGLYTLQVETDGGIPIEFEIKFVRVGS